MRRLGAGVLLVVLAWCGAQVVARARLPNLSSSRDLIELARARALLPGDAAAWRATGGFWLVSGYPLRAVGAFKAALRRFPFDGDAWLSLGDAQMRMGHRRAARRAVRNAVDLYPTFGGAQAGAATLLLQLGYVRAGAEALRAAVRLQPGREPAAYDLAWTLFDDPDFILDHVVPPARLSSYLHITMSRGRLADARAAWERLRATADIPEQTRLNYLGFLIHRGHLAEARSIWAAEYGPLSGGTIYEGGFEGNPVGAGFGWRILPVEGAETEIVEDATCRDSRCARIRFTGTTNLHYHHLRQVVPIDVPGRYRLQAWLRADGITSLSGPRLLVSGTADCRLHAVSADLQGDHGWHARSVEFAVPHNCGGVLVGVERPSTNRLDWRISGTLWLDDVTMERLGS